MRLLCKIEYAKSEIVAIFHIFSKYPRLYKMLYDSYIQAYLIFPSSVSVFHLIQPTLILDRVFRPFHDFDKDLWFSCIIAYNVQENSRNRVLQK